MLAALSIPGLSQYVIPSHKRFAASKAESVSPMEAPRTGPTVKVILIHGVGDTAPNELVAATRSEFEAAGIDPSDVYEFNWNSIVQQPFAARVHKGEFPETSWMNGPYVAKLGNSVLNGALIPLEEGCTPWTKAVLSWLQYLMLLAQALPAMVAIILISYFVGASTVFRLIS